MSEIDVSKIRPGDKVRGRVAVEFSGAVMPDWSIDYDEDVKIAILGSEVTILEHIPARPDWADALVVRDRDGDPWGARLGCFVQLGGYEATGVLKPDELGDRFAPITVVIDADGNPATEAKPLTVGDLNAAHLGQRVRVQGGMGDHDNHVIAEAAHNAARTHIRDELGTRWGYDPSTPCELLGGDHA